LQPMPTIEYDWGPWLKSSPGTVAYQMIDKFQPQQIPAAVSAESRQTRPRADRRLDPEERVLGLAIGEESDAWPLRGFGRGLAARQVTVGGRPVTLLWDGQIQTAVAYAPESEGTVKRTVTLMVDETNRDAPWIDKETGSRWSITGRALSGRLKGETLTWLPGVVVKWYAWSASHPQTALEGQPTSAGSKSQN